MSESLRATNAFAPEECPICGESLAHPDELDENKGRHEIYRAHRRAHYEWGEKADYNPDEDPYLSRNAGPDVEDEDFDQQCILDTQLFEVEFRSEYVETVVVEASSKGEAKRFAEHERSYDGQYMHTMHTEKRPVGEPSQASIDYLELTGLLPDDHDVTPEDIAAISAEEGS